MTYLAPRGLSSIAPIADSQLSTNHSKMTAALSIRMRNGPSAIAAKSSSMSQEWRLEPLKANHMM